MKLIFDASALIPLYRGILSDRSIGGTETALIQVSDELSRRGVSIDIRTSLDPQNDIPENTARYPRYLHRGTPVSYQAYDACIVLQNWRIIPYLPSMPIYLWTGDGAEQYSNFGIGDVRVYNRIRSLIVTTKFHKESLCKSSGFPIHKCHVVGNGFSEFFINQDLKNRKGMIFHSAPYRGLEHALRYLSILRKEGIEDEMRIYSDMELYKREGQYQGPYAEVIHILKKKYAHVSHVLFHQTVPQVRLAEQLKTSKVFPYPCTVPEVFCMSMLEAMASGVVPLVSDIGGLSEVLGDDDLVVSGIPGSATFDKEFLKRLSRLLQDEGYRMEKAKGVQARALQHFTWSMQAETFLGVLT